MPRDTQISFAPVPVFVFRAFSLASTAASTASSAGEENLARTWGPIGKALRDAPNGVAQTRATFTKQGKNGKDTYFAAPGDETTMRAVYAFAGVSAVVFLGGT
jgi:hypothetical protein